MSAAPPRELQRRRTFAIISHPDAGKTTLTEKLLLYGGAIQLAGAVKAKRSQRGTASDFLEMEQERGISVSTSVMRFDYEDWAFNLLDTPGHNDFSEDTYRTLTAVDSVLMVIDGSKGVENQTRKLLAVCRLKQTPVITFMNKYDLETMDPINLIDNLEAELGMLAVPMTWPIGKGRDFKGVYDLRTQRIHISTKADADDVVLDDPFGDEAFARIGEELLEQLATDLEFIEGVTPAFDATAFGAGEQTPIFFGSALNNFGVQAILDAFGELAPPPLARPTTTRQVDPGEDRLTGFVFKIQANLDKNHRDRMAFVRLCSGVFERGMRLKHVRTGKQLAIRNAMTFLARSRTTVEEAYPGDIIGVPNHGTIRIGDTFTEGEELAFTGVPSFAPELFRRAVLQDPLRGKALAKGLEQMAEEGAAQLFRPLIGADYYIGVVGDLQFQVIASRLSNEYNVAVRFSPMPWTMCRWVDCDDDTASALKDRFPQDTFIDGQGRLCLISSSRHRIELVERTFPDVVLSATTGSPAD